MPGRLRGGQAGTAAGGRILGSWGSGGVAHSLSGWDQQTLLPSFRDSLPQLREREGAGAGVSDILCTLHCPGAHGTEGGENTTG